MEWGLLSALNEEERRVLLSRTRRRRFARGEVIFHEGDPGDTIHLLAKGHVAIRRTTPLGDVATLLIAGPGEFFGELVMISPDAGRNATVSALDAVETLSLHRRDLDELRRQHAAIDRFLLDALAKEVRRLSSLLSDALYVPVEKRVIRRLLEVANLYRRDGSEGTTIPLTQEDLAGLAGTTRPTTNTVLRSVQEAGLVRVSRGKIDLVDTEGLARRAR